MFLVFIICILMILLAYVFFTPMGVELGVAAMIILFAMLPLINSGIEMVQKSKTSEALNLLTGARNAAVIHYASRGEWPATQHLMGVKQEGLYSMDLQSQAGSFSMALKGNETLQGRRLGLTTAFPQDYPVFLLTRCGYSTFPDKVMQASPMQTTLPKQYLPFICRS